MHCPNTWRAEPQRKISFPFSRKISPPPNQKSKRHFSFGVAGVLASAWGFLRIICFENRFEFGTIETPEQNSTIFLKQKCGTREARPKDSRRISPTNSEFLARKRAVFFRQEAGAKQEAILTHSICLIQKEFILL